MLLHMNVPEGFEYRLLPGRMVIILKVEQDKITLCVSLADESSINEHMIHVYLQYDVVRFRIKVIKCQRYMLGERYSV